MHLSCSAVQSAFLTCFMFNFVRQTDAFSEVPLVCDANALVSVPKVLDSYESVVIHVAAPSV